MQEISEGDTKFLHTMKLIPPEDVGFQVSKVPKCWKLSMQALLSFLMLADALGESGAD